MDDKKLPVVWYMGEEHDIYGRVMFGEYDLYIGICETNDSYLNPREVSMFLHCKKPYECELIETTALNTAVALNVITTLTQADIARMVKDMME